MYKLPQGDRRVCITPTQHAKLFGGKRPPRAIGHGKYAYVYPSRDFDRVVKITRDKTDLAALVRAKGHAAPHVFHVYKLAQARKPLYALVVEKLTPLKRSQRAQEIIDCFGNNPRVLRVQCCRLRDRAAQRQCHQLLRDLSKGYRELRKRGIHVKDIHAGNVGRDTMGRWKFLDLGQSRVKLLTKTLRTLAG